MAGIVMIVIIIFTTHGPIDSGELLPLPPERPQQQQKSVDPGVYIEFRQRVEPLKCPDLKQLREKLINTCSSQQNQANVNYYMKLKNIVDEVLTLKKCP
jgi:hypothetical protein